MERSSLLKFLLISIDHITWLNWSHYGGKDLCVNSTISFVGYPAPLRDGNGFKLRSEKYLAQIPKPYPLFAPILGSRVVTAILSSAYLNCATHLKNLYLRCYAQMKIKKIIVLVPPFTIMS